MSDACRGDVGKIEGKLAVSLATGNDHLHTEAMSELLNGYVNGRKNLPDEIKRCNAQRVKEDENHPWLQTLTIG